MEYRGIEISEHEIEQAKEDLQEIAGSNFAMWSLHSGHFHTARYGNDWSSDYDHEIIHYAYCCKKETTYLFGMLTADSFRDAIDRGILDDNGELW